MSDISSRMEISRFSPLVCTRIPSAADRAPLIGPPPPPHWLPVASGRGLREDDAPPTSPGAVAFSHSLWISDRIST